MTPAIFTAKWRANARTERAASQEHFLDLCALLGEPTPNSDPTGANYAFEKGATKASGGEGWADVWRRDRFAWEYKGKHRDLEAAHRQLLQYAGALENPPLLVTSDIERISIRTNWNGLATERHELHLDDLADPARLATLHAVFANPDRLRPDRTRAALTADAAAEFAGLAQRLRARGHDPQATAHFVNRLVFCLFATDTDLLPPGLLDGMLAAAARTPARFEHHAAQLFAAMAARGGEVGFTPVAWFNGGLFDDARTLPLEADDIAGQRRAATLDWAEIDPSILGTLFERGLDPDKRSQLGAHYTGRAMIERLVDPVVRRPLLAEWAFTRARMEAALATAPARAGSRTRRDPHSAAQAMLRAFLDRLRAFRVLDPACGSGNFLYLALLALKDIEHDAMVEAEAMGLQREFHQVGPEAVLGIEINPYAAELARVSVWIGHIQWQRRHGLPPPSDPILKRLDTIECRDAVLGDDGRPAPWPAADAIIGNPPFLGDKAMLGVMGADYTNRLRVAYAGRVPGAANLVCYWFEKAREALKGERLHRVGFVSTESIRKGSNRSVIEAILDEGEIVEAWSNEPWILDGASLRVSLICFSKVMRLSKFFNTSIEVQLDGKLVRKIYADLTAGDVDFTTAIRLYLNANICFQGPVKVGSFDIPGILARSLLLEPSNPNGCTNSDVVRPWVNAMDVVRRPSDIWIVDFKTQTQVEASFYIGPFAHVEKNVRPDREKNRRERRARYWWQHGETGAGMRHALTSLSRYIATPRVAKHRIFVWLHQSVLPDSRLFIFAREDDALFGILHSRIHEIWSLTQASRHGVGNDPCYNAATCFETFPFPDALTPDLPAASYAENPRAIAIAEAARALVAARDRWLNPPELVERVPEVVPGFPDRLLPRDAAAAATLRSRTLTALYNTRATPEGAWLDGLHRALDAAVAAAYGWPAALDDAEVLARLLALNLARAR